MTASVSTELANALLIEASVQGNYTFTQIDTCETVDSVTLGDGQYLIMYRMYWSFSKPIAIKIEGVTPTVNNDEILQQISVTAFVQGNRQLEFKAKGDAIGSNGYAYAVYKVS